MPHYIPTLQPHGTFRHVSIDIFLLYDGRIGRTRVQILLTWKEKHPESLEVFIDLWREYFY